MDCESPNRIAGKKPSGRLWARGRRGWARRKKGWAGRRQSGKGGWQPGAAESNKKGESFGVPFGSPKKDEVGMGFV